MAQPQLTNSSTALNTTPSPEVQYEPEDRIIRINFRPQGPWRYGEDDSISRIKQHTATAVKVILDIDFSQPGASTPDDKVLIQNRITKIRDVINGGNDPETKVPNEIADVQVTVHMRQWSTMAMECFGSFDLLDAAWDLNFTEGGGASQLCYNSRTDESVDLELYIPRFGQAWNRM